MHIDADHRQSRLGQLPAIASPPGPIPITIETLISIAIGAVAGAGLAAAGRRG